MNNNYDFWQKYLKLVKKELKKLCHEKDELHIDLHMHSNYSADGKQSVSQLIENTKNKESIKIKKLCLTAVEFNLNV